MLILGREKTILSSCRGTQHSISINIRNTHSRQTESHWKATHVYMLACKHTHVDITQRDIYAQVREGKKNPFLPFTGGYIFYQESKL